MSLETINAFPADTPADGLLPLSIIRTETILSRMPVHNLAKKGRVDIRILRKSGQGEVLLKWEVSHNDRYGQARQLAYKIDTLVVNKRIDEADRPLPVLIRIGSLKEVCRMLGISENGKNLRDVRTAFLQNASAFINAQFTYRTVDGVTKRLEAGFTRYGVIFTGEKLPDGRSADAVYVALNPPYWEVVNSAPFRPLDYDYLRALAPAAQRFYEIVSFRIFAALRQGRPAARISYSDYCAFSAQQRYYDHEHFRVQMYKIHRPHLASGYLKEVQVESARDGEGKPDWVLSYTPGPKARAEFHAFTRRQEQRRPLLEAAEEGEVLRALVDRGITDARARKLLAAITPAQPVMDQLEWGDFLVREARPGTFRNPPGFYFALVRDDVRPPDTFLTTGKLQEASRGPASEEQAAQRDQKRAYARYREQQAQAAFDAIPEEQRAARVAERRREYARKFPSLPSQTLEEISMQAARREIEESLPLMPLEEFSRRSASVPDGPNGPAGSKGRKDR